jgi:hypothetical protein
MQDVPIVASPIQALAIIHCDEIYPSASRVLEGFLQADAIYYATRKQQNIICGQGGKHLRVLALQDIGPARCIMNCPSLETLILVHASIERMQVAPTNAVYLYGLDAHAPSTGCPRNAYVSTEDWSQKMLLECGPMFTELQDVW